MGEIALSFGFLDPEKPLHKVVKECSESSEYRRHYPDSELVSEEFKERAKKRYQIKYDMHN